VFVFAHQMRGGGGRGRGRGRFGRGGGGASQDLIRDNLEVCDAYRVLCKLRHHAS